MRALVWGLEWRLTLANRRDLALLVLGPLSLVLVIATGALPAGASASTYVVLFVGLGMLRAALNVLEAERAGIAARLLRGGISPAGHLLERAAAAAALTFVGLLPSMVVVVASSRPSAAETILAGAALALGLWIAGVLGVALAAASRSGAEALVSCAVTLVLLLHVSGVFRAPPPGGMGETLEGLSPFGVLHEALGGMISGGGASGFRAAAAWAVLVPILVGLLAPRLTGDPPSRTGAPPVGS